MIPVYCVRSILHQMEQDFVVGFGSSASEFGRVGARIRGRISSMCQSSRQLFLPHSSQLLGVLACGFTMGSRVLSRPFRRGYRH